MSDELLKQAGAGMPAFGRILLDPDQNTGGEEGPDVKFPVEGLAAEMEKANTAEAAETVAETPAAETQEASQASTETPATTVEDKTDYKAELEKFKAESEGYAKKLAEEEYRNYAQQLASKSPALYEQVYGVKPPPGMFQEEKPAADPKTATPQDALAKDLAELKAWRAQEIQSRQEAEARQRFEAESAAQAKRIYESMNKHKDIFDDPEIGDDAAALAVAKFTQAINANPKTANPDLIAEGIAKKFKAKFEAIKAGYTQGKQETAKKIPIGAGTGGRQAGAPAKKQSWDDLERGFGDAMKKANSGEAE